VVKAVAVKGETDCPGSETGVEEGVDYRKDAEDGEGNADVGYYIGCVCHFLFLSLLFFLALSLFCSGAGPLSCGEERNEKGEQKNERVGVVFPGLY
jgi:hypothetical protein